MGFEERFRSALARLRPVESDWKFKTSAGGDLTISTPIARVGVNATGGALWVQRDSDANPTTLRYGGIGGSLGVSLVPTPVNFSFSIPQFPSTGVIYKLPFAGRTLSLNELKGNFVMMELSGDLGPGGSGAIMFLGGSQIASSLAGAVSAGSMAIPALIATSNGAVMFGGMTATVIPVNASVIFYVGAIF